MKIKVKKLISGILAFSTFLGVGETKIALADDTSSIENTKEQTSLAQTENKDKEEVNPYAITVLKELKEFKNAYDKEKGIDKKKDLVKSELDKVSAQLQKTQNKDEEAALLLKKNALKTIRRRTPKTVTQDIGY